MKDRIPYIIAEIGVNHDGKIDRAAEMVGVAEAADADAVKFQAFKADLLGQPELAKYEVSDEWLGAMVNHARKRKLDVIVTAFSAEYIPDLDVDAWKVASPEITNRDLIEALRKRGKPIIVSTGGATMKEILDAWNWLWGDEATIFMQCVSAYPCPDDKASIGGRKFMAGRLLPARGYSDHTLSVDTGALAVAAGATMLEKHITLDRSLPGGDHHMSLEPYEFREYVQLARRAYRMLGPYEKKPLDIETKVRRKCDHSST